MILLSRDMCKDCALIFLWASSELFHNLVNKNNLKMDVGVIAFVCLSTQGKSPFGLQFNFLLFCVNTWVSVANLVRHWTFYLDPEDSEILNSRFQSGFIFQT